MLFLSKNVHTEKQLSFLNKNQELMMSYNLLRFITIFLLTLLCLTAGCVNGFKKKTVPGSYTYQKKEFKKMVEKDPFPTAASANQSFWTLVISRRSSYNLSVENQMRLVPSLRYAPFRLLFAWKQHRADHETSDTFQRWLSATFVACCIVRDDMVLGKTVTRWSTTNVPTFGAKLLCPEADLWCVPWQGISRVVRLESPPGDGRTGVGWPSRRF